MLEQWIIAMTVLTVIQLTESSTKCCFDKGNISPIIRVDENKTAIVSCPALGENETLKHISLHKGDRRLHAKDMETDSPQSQQQDRLHLSEQNSSFSYKILRSEANDTGLYCCTIHTAFRTHTSQTILVVKEPLQPTEPPSPCPVKHTLLLIVGCGIFITYNLFITVRSGFLAYKLKNTEPPENPYMNTRPGGFRRR